MLKEELEKLKETAAQKISPEKMKKMLQSRVAVESSGILGRVIQRGEKIPDFSLEDSRGRLDLHPAPSVVPPTEGGTTDLPRNGKVVFW